MHVCCTHTHTHWFTTHAALHCVCVYRIYAVACLHGIMYTAHTHTHMYMCVLSHPHTNAHVGVSSHSCDDRTHLHVQKYTNVIMIVQKH